MILFCFYSRTALICQTKIPVTPGIQPLTCQMDIWAVFNLAFPSMFYVDDKGSQE